MTFNVLFFGLNGLFKLFLPCYYGTVIQWESENFIWYIYDARWIEIEFHLKQNFLIIQKNFQQPVTVKAAKVLEINLETFVEILQWTYTMYASLHALKNKI